jgi:hypothetical protein
MRTADQIIALIDNVLSNFLIDDLKDRNELLRIRSRLVMERTINGRGSYVENSKTIYRIILEISARC